MHHPHKANRVKSCLARLAALEKGLDQAGRGRSAARGETELPAAAGQQTRALIREARALLPKPVARQVALPVRKASLTELALLAGQARASLAHFAETESLDQPAPSAQHSRELEDMRTRLTARLKQIQDGHA